MYLPSRRVIAKTREKVGCLSPLANQSRKLSALVHCTSTRARPASSMPPVTRSTRRNDAPASPTVPVAPANLELFESCLLLLANHFETLFGFVHCLKLGCTCHALNVATLREDLWMVLLFKGFPSSVNLPAAVFQLEAGRGYRWYFMQRVATVPLDEDDAPEELPPPALCADNVIMLVELSFDEEESVISHACKGAEMEKLLRTGSVCIPIPPGMEWTRRADLEVNESNGCWSGWGLRWDVNDHMINETLGDMNRWSVSVHLLRLTDFKSCCLMDDSALLAEWSFCGEALGRAWRSTPDTFDAQRPFDHATDLIEGGSFEMVQSNLPMQLAKLGGLVCAHMLHEQTAGLSFYASPSFRLPPSPCSFVYEQAVEGLTVDCMDASNFEILKLRRKLDEAWGNMSPQARIQAIRDAGGYADGSDAPLNTPVSGQVALSELRLSFGSIDHDGCVNIWTGYDESHDGGDRLLMHMLDGLAWK